MPQKKNPDVLELARGRTGRCIGDLVALLTLLKGLPLTYNRDLQEDKPAFFDSVDTAAATLTVITEIIEVVGFHADRMAAAASDPALAATDVAEYLVAKGVPFREAHTIVGAAVHDTHSRGQTIGDLSAARWKQLCPRAGADIVDIFNSEHLLRRRELPGAPGPRAVSSQLTRARRQIAATRTFAASADRRR
jgi:argininosuccinate lyase